MTEKKTFYPNSKVFFDHFRDFFSNQPVPLFQLHLPIGLTLEQISKSVRSARSTHHPDLGLFSDASLFFRIKFVNEEFDEIVGDVERGAIDLPDKMHDFLTLQYLNTYLGHDMVDSWFGSNLMMP